jgi:hypothetical protein
MSASQSSGSGGHTKERNNKHDPFGGLAYFGFLGLFLGFMFLAVVLETFAICQEENQQEEDDLILGAKTSPREDLRTRRGFDDTNRSELRFGITG